MPDWKEFEEALGDFWRAVGMEERYAVWRGCMANELARRVQHTQVCYRRVLALYRAAAGKEGR